MPHPRQPSESAEGDKNLNLGSFNSLMSLQALQALSSRLLCLCRPGLSFHLVHLCHPCQFYHPCLVKHLTQPCWLSRFSICFQHCSIGNRLVTGVSDKSFVNLPHNCVILLSLEESPYPTFLSRYLQVEKSAGWREYETPRGSGTASCVTVGKGGRDGGGRH